MTSRPRKKLRDNLSLSSKLFLKEILASSTAAVSTLLNAPLALSRRVLGRAEKNDLEPQLIELSNLSPTTLADKRATRDAVATAIKTSIVIPVFNKAAFTLQCIQSLVHEIDLNETEIIVVDNASTDETAEVLEQFGDLLTVVKNEENRGFVDACNQGAAVARGNYLLFLNNDTTVSPGWLDVLLETIESEISVGAVGSMLLYPDGSIQEAGSIIWKSGEGHHYGWGASPDDRRFTYAREVDYCSAASLLIRKEIFQRLGGFDRRYAPAYYEDVDLCFGVRSLGYKVVYQPASRVVHYEGVTAGRDVSKGIRQFEVVNRQKFSNKWKDVLGRDHLEKNLKLVDLASRPRNRAWIIVFDERIPTPDRDAGSARILMILKALAKWSNVVFVAFHGAPGAHYEQALWKEGIETAGAVQYRSLLKSRQFQAAIVSRATVGDALIRRVRRISEKTKIVFDMVDAHFIRLEREYSVSGNPAKAKEADAFKRLETRLARESDVVWCASPEDKKVMDQAAPGKRIEVIPTIHELHATGKPFEQRHDLLFVGNLAHRPNSDGVQYFLTEIFPLIEERLPRIKLIVVGDNAESIQPYASEKVLVTGHVPDIEDYWRSARVFIAPLRFGAGAKGKIGDAMSYGLPVVTTPLGAEGFGLVSESNIMIADSPRDFADAVIKLYSSRELWETIACNSRKHIENNFTPEVIAETINNSIREIVGTDAELGSGTRDR